MAIELVNYPTGWGLLRGDKMKLIIHRPLRERNFSSEKAPLKSEGGRGRGRSEEDTLKLLESIESPMFSSYVLGMLQTMKDEEVTLKEILRSKPVREYARKLGIENRLEKALRQL